MATSAFAQTAPAPASKPVAAPATPAAAHKLSSQSLVGDILDNPKAKAILIKYVPAIGEDDQIEQARGMALRDLQQYEPETFSDETLKKIDADLAALPSG
ncbi:MAG TPA: hypothetical protein VN157_03590 [Caulobacter sp.]|nr:hypothetical protein [Caulobacter sp.]